MNFKTLFNWKCKPVSEPIAVEEKKYMVGYEIHCIDGSIKKNMCVDVPQSLLEDRAKTIKAEINGMMIELEKASKKNQTFVEIESNVYRVADVKSITYISYEMSQIPKF